MNTCNKELKYIIYPIYTGCPQKKCDLRILTLCNNLSSQYLYYAYRKQIQIVTCVIWIDCLEMELYPTGPSGVEIGQQGLLTLTHLISVRGVCSSLKRALQNQGHLKSSEETSQGKSVSLTRPC